MDRELISEFSFTFLIAPVPDERGRMDEPPGLWTFTGGRHRIIDANVNRLVFQTVPNDDEDTEIREFVVDLREHMIYRRPAGSNSPGEAVVRIM
jgi:hypothetical protein